MELDSSLEFKAGLSRHFFEVKSRLELESLLAHVYKCAHLVCIALDAFELDQPLVRDVRLSCCSDWAT